MNEQRDEEGNPGEGAASSQSDDSAAKSSGPSRASRGGDEERAPLETTVVRSPRDGAAEETPAVPKGAPRASFAALKPPEMDLPKGGGALRSIGEKLTVNPSTGSASLSIPLPASPAPRGPDVGVSLSYETGGGQGTFGMGWSLGAASITRRTDKKLPEYLDSQDSDVFVLAGAEDLVPLVEAGVRHRAPAEGVDLNGEFVERYRPRTEGGFARIERITHEATKTVRWRVVDRTNIARFFGTTPESRIAHPEREHQVFSWLLDRVEDDRGNVVVYEYQAEDDAGLDPIKPSTYARRKGWLRFTNRYLKRVKYGNAAPGDAETCRLELVFDYGDHPTLDPSPDPPLPLAWPLRQDAFSNMRAGFDVRTNRLCRRVLMFHHVVPSFTPPDPEPPAEPKLVRALELKYNDAEPGLVGDPRATLLMSARVVGYDAAGVSEALPPITFAYADGVPNTLTQAIDDPAPHTKNLGDFPRQRIGREVAWVDLEGDGLPGLLIDWNRSFAYKRNLGDAGFSAPRTLPEIPLGASIAGTETQLMDVAGDGTMSLVRVGKPGAGYHERDTDRDSFKTFKAFKSIPNIDWSSPNLKMMDLNGDGMDDVVILGRDHFEWYPSLGKGGWDKPRRIAQPADPERGPALLHSDRNGAVFLADMTGDGLTDLVRVERMRVMYWPNLGRGRFGPAITMDNSPKLALLPGGFHPERVRLADLDNTGPADLIYIDIRGMHLFLNQAGNGFDDGHYTETVDPYDALLTLSIIDLYGGGTKTITWSTQASWKPPLKTLSPYAEKPFLLKEVDNGMGLTMRLSYTTSTKLSLADRTAGHPWATRLPFPVHVVTRVEHYDAVSRTRLVTKYKHRHGFYDRAEREFRGFGYVEQMDTESFDEAHGLGLFLDRPPPENAEPPEDGEAPTAPVLTKTWFHTGAWFEQQKLEDAFAEEYWKGDEEDAPPRRAHVLPEGLTPREQRDAARALRGSMLRQEVYGLDDATHADVPFVVTEASYQVRLIQPESDARTDSVPDAPRPPHAAVMLSFQREQRTLHYERNASDPRIQQSLSLNVDRYGTVKRAAEIGYPRRAPEHPEQGKVLAFVVESDVVHLDVQADGLRLAIPTEARAYDMTGLQAPDGDLFDYVAFRTAYDEADVLAPHESPTPPPTPPALPPVERRLVERSLTQYVDSNHLPDTLELGEVDLRAIVHQSYLQAFTDDLVNDLYDGRVDSTLLASLGYVTPDGETAYWLHSGHSTFDGDHFFLPTSFVDARENTTTVTYDADFMFVTSMTDPLGNVVTADIDYHHRTPHQITDPNLNRAAVAFDALGRTIKMAVLGKASAPEGDTLTDPTVEYEYVLDAWSTSQAPNYAHVLARETHGGGSPRFQESYVYSDGSGNIALSKAKVAPGDAPLRNLDGTLQIDGGGNLILGPVDPRWVGSGKAIKNSKGLVVKQYEPFFSSTSAFEDEDELVKQGVTSVVTYDAVGRVTRIDLPNGTYRRSTWDAWSTTTYDENDTIFGDDGAPGDDSIPQDDSLWFEEREDSGTAPASEKRARQLTEAHANTPTKQHRDMWGRAFRVEQDAGGVDPFVTRTTLDIFGQPLILTDALGRDAQKTFFAMGGLAARGENIDAGTRWTLSDVRGTDTHRWDQRLQHFRTVTDALGRPTHVYVKVDADPEMLLQRQVYGESIPVVADAQSINALGQLIASYDGAGAVLVDGYDFKGNLLASSRRLVADSETTPDWIALASLTDPAAIDAAAAADLETEVFTTSATYDALNRPTSQTTPDASITRPTYDDGGALVAVEVDVRGVTPAESIVTAITYDAKGQRQSITYGNGTATAYDYDPLTYRLKRLVTTRTSPSATLQDLSYTYDPIGNIVEIVDAAQQTAFFDNTAASPSMRYAYDPIYRLTYAEGREHAGLIGDDQRDERDLPIHALPHANDMSAVRRYEETYAYDAVGNFLTFAHVAVGNSSATWTRHYDYGDGKPNNRLQSTSLPGDTIAPYSATYGYDAHGNITSMPHLSAIDWDPMDQMQRADLGGGGEVFFTYDGGGQRVRKFRKHIGTLVEERIYLGSFEIYRKRSGSTLQVERETLHVMDGVRRVAMIETKTVDTGVVGLVPTPRYRFQLGNHLETAHLEVDDTGLVISYEEMHPYGTSAYRSASGAVEVSARRYRYTGKERDDETGLDYFGARYYASWLGRWVSADPLGVQAGINLYLYCRAGPVVLVDPDGREDRAPEVIQVDAGGGIKLTLEVVDPSKRLDDSGHADSSDVQSILKGAKPKTDSSTIGPPPPGKYYRPQDWAPGLTFVYPGGTNPGTWADNDPLYQYLTVDNPMAGEVVQTIQNLGAMAMLVTDAHAVANGFRSTIPSRTPSPRGELSPSKNLSSVSGGANSSGAIGSLEAEAAGGPGAAGPTLLFRPMKEGAGGKPMLGPTARTLGVRTVAPPGGTKFNPDIPVVGGKVQPGTGGMSVTPDDPRGLPLHRRPPELGGEGKDPLWVIEETSLGSKLQHRRDPTNPAQHGFVEPAEEMDLGDFEDAIAATIDFWRKVF